MITVPRPNPSTQLPLDVSDILDEIDAWSFYSPTTSTSTSTVMLSPPRVPHSPSPPPTTSSASALEKRDAIKFVVSGASAASRPPSSPTPSMSTTIYATTAAANNCSDHEDYDENRFCSHQSFSPLDLPVSSVGAAAAAQAPIANPALRRFQIGSVVRRMRMRRAASDGSKGSKDAAATPKVATPARTTSAPALGRRPQRQRKPIPF
ncbi:hypothetical protein BJV74DRAFT_849360 [Russula compacta]|nr:hypothetical protein BJV74DRAFT_849360 [Russula compacta]